MHYTYTTSATERLVDAANLGMSPRLMVCEDGQTLDIADDAERREVAIKLFLADLPRFIAENENAFEDGVTLTFGLYGSLEDPAETLAERAYFVEVGRGSGTWHEASLDVDPADTDAVLARIAEIVREVADDAWDVDVEQIATKAA